MHFRNQRWSEAVGLYALSDEDREHMKELVAYCLETFPGRAPPADAPGRDEPAVILLHQTVQRMADLAASYMAAGFVHGVLNSDNMNISGESFDYAPRRWLPEWDPGFTAAYFDYSGLYAFGRQPESINWNCAQLAMALRLLADSEPLIAALERFGGLCRLAMTRRFAWRLGLIPRGLEEDASLIGEAERHMREHRLSPDAFFFRHRAGRIPPDDAFGRLLRAYKPAVSLDDPIWMEEAPPTLVIEEVERVWEAIDKADDWTPLNQKIAEIRALGSALGQYSYHAR